MHLFSLRYPKFTALACIIFCLLVSLGYWQLQRAQEKTNLLKNFANRNSQLITPSQLLTSKDYQYYRLKLLGKFDNQHTLLLDNRVFHGQVGYEVYTPFVSAALTKTILVDRGFIPRGSNRKNLPAIKAIAGEVEIEALITHIPKYFSLGKMLETAIPSWPLRVQYLAPAELTPHLGYELAPYILQLSASSAYAYPIEWQIVVIPPERHRGYALQWFALAFTLLILLVTLNRTHLD